MNELWTTVPKTNRTGIRYSFNAVHLSILFAIGVIAITIILIPVLSQKMGLNTIYSNDNSYDDLITGSIGRISEDGQKHPSFKQKRYTIRRSVTQSDACIILNGQMKTEDC